MERRVFVRGVKWYNNDRFVLYSQP